MKKVDLRRAKKPTFETNFKRGPILPWIIAWLASKLRIETENVDSTLTFMELGLSSAEIFAFIDDLSKYIGKSVNPVDVYDNPTPERMSFHVEKILENSVISS